MWIFVLALDCCTTAILVMMMTNVITTSAKTKIHIILPPVIQYSVVYTFAGTSTGVTKTFTPSIRSTFTRVPSGMISPEVLRAVQTMAPSFA